MVYLSLFNLSLISGQIQEAVNIKLSDYGISRQSFREGALGVEGTPGYQAPEIRPGIVYDEKVLGFVLTSLNQTDENTSDILYIYKKKRKQQLNWAKQNTGYFSGSGLWQPHRTVSKCSQTCDVTAVGHHSCWTSQLQVVFSLTSVPQTHTVPRWYCIL